MRIIINMGINITMRINISMHMFILMLMCIFAHGVMHMALRISMRSFRPITPPVASRMRSVIKISPFYFCDFFIDI